MRCELRGALFLVAVFAGLTTMLLTPGKAQAVLIEVDNTDDFPDEDPGDGVCRGRLIYGAIRRCSLRAAIQEANATPGVDNIVLEAKTYSLVQDPEGTSGPEPIARDLTITGVGRTSTTVELGTNPFRKWQVNGNVTARFVGLTVSHGIGMLVAPGANTFLTSARVDGATGTALSISQGATMTATNSIVSNTQNGLAISNQGNLTIDTTTISDNRGVVVTGLANFAGASATITNSLFVNNVGNSSSGATLRTDGALNVANTTLSGNSGPTAGGIQFGGGNVALVNVTVANNTGPGFRTQGGGIFLQNVLLANNTGGNCNGAPNISGQAPNLQQNFDSDGACAFPAGSNLTGNPHLGPLASNGGPTQTHALQLGSPAIDVANCSAAAPADQRGTSRPRDGNGDTVAQCDIGAFERTVSDFRPPVGVPGLTPHTATVRVDEPFTQTLTWDVPNVEAWRALQSIDYRLRGPTGIVFWLRWDQVTNLFQVLDANGSPVGPAFQGGTPFTLGTRVVTLDLSRTSATGSGPTGQRVTLTLSLTFGRGPLGRSLAVEASATDDLGTVDPFRQVGTLLVDHGRGPAPHALTPKMSAV
ncbi:MAG: right-handed parallel beta-helix repeat-containing protein [Chloroflexota bacterium]